MTINPPVLLTDEQMRRFVTDGYLLLKTDFPKSFHDALTAQLDKVYEEEGNPGNNLLPRIRELRKVFDHPAVTGALTSVLGPNYMLHAHRHGHFNATPKPGGWHKDSYWGYKKQRNHHPWWAMIMYFPQDTPVELGPTGLLPGTQNYETRVFETEDPAGEALAAGEAGTFLLIHYDIWHRSTANVLGKPRYMLKFEFMRTSAPTAPSWDNRDAAWSAPATVDALPARHDLLWEETWRWLRGEVGAIAGSLPADDAAVADAAARLAGDDEPDALNAAYELAARGDRGIAALAGALLAGGAAGRAASYGLAVAGAAAVPALREALASADEKAAARGAFALGELRGLAAGAVPALVDALGRAEPRVRRAAVEALGLIGPAAGAHVGDAVAALARALADDDAQTRFTAGLSLARLGSAAAAAVPALVLALDDENRYVRAHAAEALRYIGTPEANEALLHELTYARWCSTTTKESTFYP
ncbi:phytanoyl-CoA dioxygenase [Paenibacillus antri]|uniref:Phytanoyl-CoA dioxygenase n=1 Tax=Paenibacillus antri TaxID=2582848 RepID=A0A5R9G6C0_9BACL|nr:HEAT repeat domain-containing protein [Paenibacillus antri]TLS48313.1 phytanoyl-CoA dioxygenase [Paenibacillus antri]